MPYFIAELNLKASQKKQLTDAIMKEIPTRIRISKAQMMGEVEAKPEDVAITSRQLAQLVKAEEAGTGTTLSFSAAQLKHHKKIGLLTKLVTGEGVFDSVWRAVKKVGGVVADDVLKPAANVAVKVAKKVGRKAAAVAANAACDALALGTLTETQPELLPLALAGCAEIGNAIKGGQIDGGCMPCGGVCGEGATKKRGRPRK